MLTFLKRNLFIVIIFIFTLSLGFLTFLTFIDKSFIQLNDKNLNYLLIADIVLLIIFFIIIFNEVKNSIKDNINVRGSVANRKYILFFSLFTLIPSLLISTFSLFLFSFALEKYFDKKITTVVNNSYELAKSYVEEKRNKIESDIILVSIDLNQNYKNLSKNPKQFQIYLNNQRIIRGLDQIHLINNKKEILLSSSVTEFVPIEDKALKMVLNDYRPLKIINAFENKSAAIIKLSNFENTYLYVVKFLDEEISNYLTDSQEAINFYYTVEEQSTGIKISFAFIYIIVVTLLLFISISIAIRFSSRFFRSINNLIIASTSIGKGNLDIKVPEVKTDKDLEVLNKNFNSMINRLKNQQEKLIINERYEAWGSLARKLAHEIKNPLTPIQLTIDRIKNKYSNQISNDDKDNFKDNLRIINTQIKQIEKLVNEFSDFARMTKPIFKENDLVKILSENIKLLSQIDQSIIITFNDKRKILLNCDKEQMNRVFFNLIKNSVESILQKSEKNPNFKKKILIEILSNNDHIIFKLTDNGIGFDNIKNDINKILNPYYTTKKNGTGLGLAIVNKIVNDHNGELNFFQISEGAKIEIYFKKYGNRNSNS